MDKPKIELKLPIIANMELVAINTAEVVAKHMDLSEDKAAEISMALIEACINAFEHSQAQNNVFIHFILEEDTLVIKVIDQGIGFDKSKVQIPKIENKLGTDERKRGWGLQLIKELMDTVEFESTKEGTTVTMTKKERIMSQFNVNIQEENDLVILITEGYLNNEGGEMISNICYENISNGKTRFLLDMAQTKVVNSIGVSILIEIIEKLQEVDGKLGYYNLAPIVDKTFKIMGLTKYSSVYANKEEALADF